MAAKVITFINMKGGVGKTTLAVNIAHTLATEHKKKVLLIDMDPQMNATQYVLNEEQLEEIINDKAMSIYKILSPEYKLNTVISDITQEDEEEHIIHSVGEFDIIPSSLRIIELHLLVSPFKLDQYIKHKLSKKYDVIIIDCPPTISPYTTVSLLASDMYLVPMRAEPLSIFGLPILKNYIDQTIESEFAHSIEFLGIVLNMVMPNKILYKKHSRSLKEKWAGKVFSAELRQCEEITKAIENDDPMARYILNLDNSKEAKEQIRNITMQIIAKGRL